MSLWGRVVAAYDAWRLYGRAETLTPQSLQDRYALLGAMYVGTWRSDPRYPWMPANLNTYANARQVVKTTGAIVDLYEQLVWQGDLSTDGKPLPDGTRGAMPIDPQTGNERSDAQLLQAFSELFKLWNLRESMSLIPKTCAIFGDLLVTLEDDTDHGAVWMQHVFPGYVPEADLELDYAGNVKRYAIEYDVEVPSSNAFGVVTMGERYRFRREVDDQNYRYYKDGRPFGYPEHGGQAIRRNPFGFVPAVWFRHERIVGSQRGMGAYERTLVQSMEINSTLSSATDYQRKQFGAPIGVIGSSLGGSRGKTLTVGNTTFSATNTEDELDAVRRASAEKFNLLPMGDGGQFVTISFDIGQTMGMVDFLYANLVAENPEAEWASKLFGLTQATGPGLQRILAPIIGKVEQARKQHDPRMIAVLQMATSMLGYRISSGDIPDVLLRNRADRYDKFKPYVPGAYDKGLMDATMPGRPVFAESHQEKAQWLALADQFTHDWALKEVGISEEEIAASELAAQKRMAQQQQLLTGTGPAVRQGPTGPSGPTAATGATGTTGPRPVNARVPR